MVDSHNPEKNKHLPSSTQGEANTDTPPKDPEVWRALLGNESITAANLILRKQYFRQYLETQPTKKDLSDAEYQIHYQQAMQELDQELDALKELPDGADYFLERQKILMKIIDGPYEIRYYVHDGTQNLDETQQAALANQFKKHINADEKPAVSTENPLQTLPENVAPHVARSFAIIESQLPGRFKFIPTTDPKQADVCFAGVPTATFGAHASFDGGGILYNLRDVKSQTDKDICGTTLHEIGHFLGLMHPFGKKINGPQIQRVNFLQSAMTYREQQLSSDVLHAKFEKHSDTGCLMPEDLRALLLLFPKKSDLGKSFHQLIGPVPEQLLSPKPTGLTLSDANGKPAAVKLLPYPNGIVFYPQPDTGADQFNFSNLPDSGVSRVRVYVRPTKDKEGTVMEVTTGGALNYVLTKQYFEHFTLPNRGGVSLDLSEQSGGSHVIISSANASNPNQIDIQFNGTENRITLGVDDLLVKDPDPNFLYRQDTRVEMIMPAGGTLHMRLNGAEKLTDLKNFRLCDGLRIRLPHHADILKNQEVRAVALHVESQQNGIYHLILKGSMRLEGQVGTEQEVENLDLQNTHLKIDLGTNDSNAHTLFQKYLEEYGVRITFGLDHDNGQLVKTPRTSSNNKGGRH